MRSHGFTLIELLVVIAIIAILAAILFPVFERVQRKAKGAACLNNLKQMAVATLLYAHDWDTMLWNWSGGNYPYDGTVPSRHAAWGGMDGALWPYLQNEGIFFCPAVRPLDYGNCTSVTNINGQTATANKSYNYLSNALWQENGRAGRVPASDWTGVPVPWPSGGVTKPAYPAKQLDYFQYPAHFWTFADGSLPPSYCWGCHVEAEPRADGKIYCIHDAGYTLGGVVPNATYPNAPPGIYYYTSSFVGGGLIARHNGTINCSFLDGHVKGMSVGMLSANIHGLGFRQGVSHYWTDADSRLPSNGQYWP